MSTVNNRPSTPLVQQLDNDDEIYAMRVVNDRAELVRARTTALFAPGQGSMIMPYVRSGNLYYRIPIQVPNSVSLQVDGAGAWTPLVVPVACTLTEIGVEVTTAGSAGATMRLGIYSDHATTPGLPQTLLNDFGVVATSTTGNQMLTGLSMSLQPYVVYWVCSIAQGSPATQASVRIYSGGTPYGSTSIATYVWSGYQTSGSTLGALPAAASTILAVGAGAGSPALLMLRLSY